MRRTAFRALQEVAEREKAVQVADLTLEEFARRYTKRVPVRKKDRYGRMTVKKDESGKPVTEEHNCYDDWIEHNKLARKWSADSGFQRSEEKDHQFGE